MVQTGLRPWTQAEYCLSHIKKIFLEVLIFFFSSTKMTAYNFYFQCRVKSSIPTLVKVIIRANKKCKHRSYNLFL